jgi:K+-sensing histidine kinase KdpD
MTKPPPLKKMMLAISSRSPKAKILIDGTAHLAAQLQAEWFVVHVPPPGQKSALVPEADLEYARSLGARVVIESLRGSVASTLVAFARTMNIDYLVTGRTGRPRFRLFFWRQTLTEQIQRKLPNTVVLIV